MNKKLTIFAIIILVCAFSYVCLANSETGFLSFSDFFKSRTTKTSDYTSSDECSESDNGRDYNTKGTVTFGGKTYTDKCLNSEILEEHYCAGTTKAATEYPCPYGCDVGNAVCKPDPSICKETDNVLDYNTKGTVTLGGKTYTDKCKDDKILYEHACAKDTKIMKEYPCPNGCVIGEGRCSTEVQPAGYMRLTKPTDIQNYKAVYKCCDADSCYLSDNKDC